VAKYAGNSESIIHRHYQRSIKRQEAELWFRMEHWSPEAEERRKAEEAWLEEAQRMMEEMPLDALPDPMNEERED
jgi:hypothetical protein